MNASVYIFGEFEYGYAQYPQDYTTDIFKNFKKNAKATTQIAIHREGDLMYYAYLRSLESDRFLGICVVLNGEILLNTDSLFRLYENIFTGLVEKGGLVQFNERGDLTTQIKHLYLNQEDLDLLSEGLRAAFDNLEKGALPPVAYSKSIDSVKNFSAEDKQTEIFDASYQYGYVYIYKSKDYDTKQLSSYRGIVAKLRREKQELSEKCEKLNVQLTAAKNRQRNMTWVGILGAIILILGVILWNKVLFPSEVTRYETGEFVYYGPLDPDKKPNGVGVAIYPKNDKDGRMYYVGNFVHGQRQDTSAMLLYKDGTYFYGEMHGDDWLKGTVYQVENQSTFIGTFKNNERYEGTQYIHEKYSEFKDGEEVLTAQ